METRMCGRPIIFFDCSYSKLNGGSSIAMFFINITRLRKIRTTTSSSFLEPILFKTSMLLFVRRDDSNCS